MTTDYRFANAHVQSSARKLLVAGDDRHIGTQAFDLLHVLIERRERVVTKNELLEHVWPGLVVEENKLPEQVAGLRKVLGPQSIATIPGRGYRFVATLDGPAGEQVTQVKATASLDVGAAEGSPDLIGPSFAVCRAQHPSQVPALLRPVGSGRVGAAGGRRDV